MLKKSLHLGDVDAQAPVHPRAHQAHEHAAVDAGPGAAPLPAVRTPAISFEFRIQFDEGDLLWVDAGPGAARLRAVRTPAT